MNTRLYYKNTQTKRSKYVSLQRPPRLVLLPPVQPSNDRPRELVLRRRRAACQKVHGGQLVRRGIRLPRGLRGPLERRRGSAYHAVLHLRLCGDMRVLCQHAASAIPATAASSNFEFSTSKMCNFEAWFPLKIQIKKKSIVRTKRISGRDCVDEERIPSKSPKPKLSGRSHPRHTRGGKHRAAIAAVAGGLCQSAKGQRFGPPASGRRAGAVRHGQDALCRLQHGRGVPGRRLPARRLFGLYEGTKDE